MTVPAAPTESGGDKLLFLVYDNGGANAAALIRGIAKATLNSESVAHLAVASQIDGQTHGASAPLVMVGGSDGTVTRKLLVNSDGRLSVELQEVPAAAALSDVLSNPTTTLVGSPQLLWDGTQWVRQRVPNIFKSFSGTVITSETTVWTPQSGKKFRLMGFVITQGVVAGDITVKDGSGGSTILTIPSTPIGQPLAVPLGHGILSGVANNLLRVIGASTETISGFVYGTEE